MSDALTRRRRVFLDGIELATCESVRVEPGILSALHGGDEIVVRLSILAKRVDRDAETGVINIVTKEPTCQG